MGETARLCLCKTASEFGVQWQTGRVYLTGRLQADIKACFFLFLDFSGKDECLPSICNLQLIQFFL